MGVSRESVLWLNSPRPRSVVGSENSYHFLSQSEVNKLNRASSAQVFPRFVQDSTASVDSSVIRQSDFFGFHFTT